MCALSLERATFQRTNKKQVIHERQSTVIMGKGSLAGICSFLHRPEQGKPKESYSHLSPLK